MKNHLVTLIFASALMGCAPAHARCKHQPAAPAVELEKIIVTPSGSYTATQWAARASSKKMLASSVTLPVMVVTPDYVITAEERHQRTSAASALHASTTPGSSQQSSLFRFIRRFFN